MFKSRPTRYFIVFSVCLYIFHLFVFAQTDSLSIISDSSYQRIGGKASKPDSVYSGEFHPTKSPTLAMGLSAILPGAGQIYTENYWKAPIIWGVGGYWIYEWIQLNDKYKQFKRDYSKTQSEQDLRLREFYRDERDKFAWFLGVLYVLNLVDAYAGAHLYDFNVSPDLSLNGRVVPKVTATVRLRF